MSTNFTHHSLESEDFSANTTIALTVILLVFLFIGFCSLYFCRCFMETLLRSRNLTRTPSGNLVADTTPAKTGLDPSLIRSFPTFPYSTIKDFRKDKYGLECAICLLEFEKESFLRLLTICCHVFHQECIDLWLESHKTCPVCRRCLDSEKSDHHDLEDAISIEIDDDETEETEETKETGETDPSASNGRKQRKNSEDDQSVKKFSRSHSTGHSIVRCREQEEEEDRYMLRIPEHIKIKIIRGHNWTGSCVTFEELSRHPSINGGGGFGEVSGSSDQTRHHPSLYHT